MTFNGTVQLGPDTEAIKAFAHFGRISPGSEYGMLHAVLHACLAETEEIPKEQLRQVRKQARSFLTEQHEKLSQYERGVLKALATM